MSGALDQNAPFVEIFNCVSTLYFPYHSLRRLKWVLTVGRTRSDQARLGTNRMFGGDQIALVDSKTRDPFAITEVLEVFTGSLSEILEKHAKYNHMMVDVPAEKAPEE